MLLKEQQTHNFLGGKRFSYLARFFFTFYTMVTVYQYSPCSLIGFSNKCVSLHRAVTSN